MKLKLIAVALPIIVFAACSNTNPESKGFELKGKLTNPHGELLVLEQMSPEGIKKIDSVALDEKGEFKITPALKEIGFYRLKIAEKNFATFVFSPDEKVSITGDAHDLGNSYTVDGSPDSKLFWDVNQASAKNYRKRDSLQKAFQMFVNMNKSDSLRVDSMSKVLEKPYNMLAEAHNKYLQDFIEKHNTSFSSLAAIQQLQPEDYYSTYVKLDAGLFAKYPNSSYIKSFHESVLTLNKLSIGSEAPEIKMNNPEGKPIALSSLRGKVVLIDFWASWCGPCRMENPNVVKAYNKYKSQGFDIFSVSLDKDVEKWKAAIAKDNLSWSCHVSDLQMWNSSVVKQYNFQGIPTNVLIDRKGNIIAKNLRGEELEKKLAEIFK